MTTISSCHIRRTTFPIKYAHAAGTPPLACSAPSECVLSISSATSAGTVAEHVFFVFFGKHFYRSDQPKTADGPNTCTSHYIVAGMPLARGVHRTSKSWLTRSNAKGMNDLQAARTLIPRKQSCSRHAAVDDCICKETHEADGSTPKGIPKRLFFFLTCRDGASNKTTKILAHTARGSRGISLFFFVLIELIEFNSLLTFLKDARERGAHEDFHTSSPLPGQVGPGLTV